MLNNFLLHHTYFCKFIGFVCNKNKVLNCSIFEVLNNNVDV